MSRRKFALQGEINAALARFVKNADGPWQFIPSRIIIKRLLNQYTSKTLYVHGTKYDAYVLNRKEALLYLASLPPPEVKENVTGRQLRNTPMFYSPFQPTIVPKCYNGKTHCKNFFTQKPNDLLLNYQRAEKYHKTVENHHPDGDGWIFDMHKTIECVFDVYNSLLRTNSVKSAYGKLLNILADEKFSKLCADGIIQACMHIIVRGVAASSLLYDSSNWRRFPRTEEELIKITGDYMKGVPPEQIIAQYKAETTLHSSHIRMELSRLRITRDPLHYHDYTKFEARSIYFYSWYWGIYQRMSKVNQTYVQQNILFEDTPTMFPTPFNAGQRFMEGAMGSPEFNKILELSRQIPSEIENKIESASERVCQKFERIASEREESLVARATDILRSFKETGTELADEVLDKVVTKSRDVGEVLAGSFEPAFEVLSSIKNILNSIVSQVGDYLKVIPGFSAITISPSSLFEALKYYIMYVNTESNSLKMILVFLILNSLGIAKVVFSEIIKYWSWTVGSATMNGEAYVAEPTSLLEWALAAPSNIMSILAGVVAYFAKGSSLTAKQFISLAKRCGDVMKNFHFIGAGLTGITKIFDYFKKFWEITSDWIMEHIFGRTTETRELAKDINILLHKLNYFTTEAGLNAIRMNENVRVQAEAIYPKWTALIAKARSDTKFRQHFIDLDRKARQVKDLSDFLTRFRSVSNFQPTMFHIQLVGRPGIGKSTITKNIVADLSKSLWPDEPTPSFYAINMNLEYFDGYAGQRIMVADDLYKINEAVHLTTSIGLITNTPVILPMANLSDKGIQLTSEILLSSTNTAYPIGKDVLCMEAVHRRRHLLVDVTCDERVIDKGLGQFSKALFDQYYPGKRVDEMPHLKFGLLKPVPVEFGGAAVDVSESEFKIFQDYAKELELANKKICTAHGDLPPTFYFTEENKPPGIRFPATGWSYEQFISNCVVRFRTFRGMEDSYTTRRKYAHVERCLAEIDNVFEQSADINAGCSFSTKAKLIEQFAQETTKPYGTLDPVGERIASGANLAPELDNVDFDQIAEDILSDATPTGIDLNEEQERTRNILNRRNKRLTDPAEKHRLRVTTIHNRYYVMLEDHPTSWDEVPEFPLNAPMSQTLNAMRNSLLEEGISMDEIVSLENEQSPFKMIFTALYEGTKEQYGYYNEAFKMLYSAEMSYPEGFGERTGQGTGLPIAFLKSIVKIDGKWYLDVTSLHSPNVERTILLKKNGKEYQVPLDVAFLYSQSAKFRVFLSEFNSMSCDQQESLIHEAQWRSNFTGSYTYAKIAADMRNTFKKGTYLTLHYLSSPFRVLIEKFPFLATMSAMLLAYLAVVWTIRRIGRLFDPQPTSKVLHRGGVASQIVYRGKPTATTQFTTIVEPLMKRNVRFVEISTSTFSAQAQALLSEQFIFVNKHLFREGSEDAFFLAVKNEEGTESIYELSLSENVYMHPEADLAIIFSRLLPSARKITQHLLTDKAYQEIELNSRSLAFLSMLNSRPLIEHFTAIGKVQNVQLRSQCVSQEVANMVLVGGVATCGRSGSTVVAADQGKTLIIGVQAWSIDKLMDPKIAVQVVTQEMFEDMKSHVIAQLEDEYIERLCEPEYVEDCEPTGAFSQLPARAMVSVEETVVGDVGKNQIQPSLIAPFLRAKGLISFRVPAAMSERDPRLYHGSNIHPLSHSLGKYYRNQVYPISKNILNRSVHSLANFLITNLDTSNFSPLSIEETITGTREDGSNPMNLNSSPGIPFIFQSRERKGKRDYMDVDEEGQVCHLDENFVQDYLRFENSLLDGKLPYTRAYDFPKDELRPIAKALGSAESPPKTRSVTCMNVFYVLAWRRYTLRLWASMHRAADGTIPFCPGINPEGPEWNNLYHYLNRHPHAVDFDVSNWDGFYFSQLFYASLDVIKRVMQIKSASKISKLLSSIFFDVMNCFIQYLNVVYQKERGLVSGFPGTAEINTLGHWLLAISIYFKLTVNTLYNTFHMMLENVSLAIYGDDIIYTFSEEIREHVNGIRLKQCYEDIGYTVTNASKTEEVEAAKPLAACTFLKSTWREFLPGYMIRKMDMEIAHDLVLWVRAKQHPLQQLYENYIDALHIAFGNGCQVFEEFQLTVNNALRQLGKDNIYYSYYDFEQDYISRYLIL